ncbi:hypothetical protein POTG_01760 [Paenibacillus sp. oral taxon 786 str. D14]|uniref:hypothetical protein n=1 Tax=Paenibacillus sp. oral taxon 786 TaxID=652715 RepID=UPI0001AFD2F7|nr:hypothetical protein [Paenibacillus sp. oral taxon 786]EES73465.1 hypothetical protein POTG_01760 [Paenibacillus sp. oral taxon 786 str. D14]
METAEKQRVTRAVSAQDWKDIERRLKGFYDPVKLVCDGYELTLILQRTGQFTNAIAVYINGKIDGKWLIEDCEERRRFFCPKSRSFYSRKDMANIKKISKRMFREMQAKNKYVYYEPFWTSFRSLKNHLIKNNKSIELVVD